MTAALIAALLAQPVDLMPQSGRIRMGNCARVAAERSVVPMSDCPGLDGARLEVSATSPPGRFDSVVPGPASLGREPIPAYGWGRICNPGDAGQPGRPCDRGRGCCSHSSVPVMRPRAWVSEEQWRGLLEGTGGD